MNKSIRLACLTATAACLTLVVRLSGADTQPPQPTAAARSAPVVAAAPTSTAAITPTPRFSPPPQLPRALVGFVTLEEFETFVKFQQTLRDDPEIKELNAQIRGKMNEMQALQKQVQLAQQKAVDSNPEIKAIADKIMQARAARPPVAPAQAAKPPVAQTPPVATTPAPK